MPQASLPDQSPTQHFLKQPFLLGEGLTLLPAAVILCREIVVSGLREFLAGVNTKVPVTTLAKYKTVLQMFAIGFLIVGPNGPELIPSQVLGESFLWIAAALTLMTGHDYLRAGLQYIEEIDDKGKKK